MENLKAHDLKSLERIDSEWDFFNPDLRSNNNKDNCEKDLKERQIRWLVKARIHDLKEGRYAMSTSSKYFNNNSLKKAMASILVAVAGMGVRVLVNFLDSSMSGGDSATV